MSNEESYLAITRYLTDEREPYAPGTHGNTKRKIRKAAACYVVRDGTLFYQRRSRGGQQGERGDFTELEVVLQDPRRKELIERAHVTAGPAGGAEHLNQQVTWENISQKYWWRGILKNVKDHIRECVQCSLDGSMGRPGRRRRAAAVHVHDEDDDEDEDAEEELDFIGPSCQAASKTVSKTSELVFVDSKGEVRQFLNKHSQTMLDKLNQQRQNNLFCDITLLIEGEEFRAHKAVLAACSDYFNQLFVEKGAVSTHEAVVDLSGFTKASFLPLLDFAYTSTLTFNFCVMAELATLAKHLLMAEVLQICESVHKQVEEQRLMVYQRGDTHTVVSSQPAAAAAPSSPQEENLLAEAGVEEDPEQQGAYMVTIQSDGQAVVTHTAGGVAESLGVVSHPAAVPAGTYVGQPAVSQAAVEEGDSGPQAVQQQQQGAVTLVADGSSSGQAGPAGESITIISRGGEGQEGETVTVVTHSGQAGESESLAVVSACLAMEQDVEEEEEEGAAPLEVVKADADKAGTAAVPTASPPTPPEGTSAPPPPPPPQTQTQAAISPEKRKRGRPRGKREVTVDLIEPVEEDDASPEGPTPSAAAGVEESAAEQQESDDPNKRRLRQRSIRLGGYARLHMGLEDEEGADKKGPQPPQQGAAATPPKVGPRQRGRPPKRPLLESEAEELARNEAEEAGGGGGAAEGAPPRGEPIAEEEAGGGAKKPKAESLETAAGTATGEAGSAVGEEHVCSDCGLSFQRRYALIMHTLKHEKARGYKCSLCSKEFQYAASLRAHLARHKQQSRPIVVKPTITTTTPPEQPGCGTVDSKAEGGGETAAATAASTTKRTFVCDICGKTLPKLYSLRIHMLNHTGVRPHSCKVCGKTFAHKHSLKMHRALHDVTKQFKCEYCHKSFVSKRSMEEHTSLHTGESKYLCNTCGATFHRGSALSKHLKKHQPKPEVRPYNCSHCDKSFYEAKDLQQHMNKHMGLKPFQCQVCGKSYSWKKDWYSHVKSHTVAEPYKCNVCGKEFFEKALFRRHVKKATHGKKGRVKQNLERECEHCGRKFTQLREYRRHINNHQGVKPFECLTCGVAWADARSLKRHVRTHTGERPYVCPLCQEAHIDARTLRKHMAKYHGENLPIKIMLEKDTLQFHNQGTQVEHAVSILASDLPPELRPALPPPSEEIETVLITEETVEAVEAVQAAEATLSDQSIMQVVNYVLAQQAMVPAAAGDKAMTDEATTEVIQTMEVEVAHVAEVE